MLVLVYRFALNCFGFPRVRMLFILWMLGLPRWGTRRLRMLFRAAINRRSPRHWGMKFRPKVLLWWHNACVGLLLAMRHRRLACLNFLRSLLFSPT